MESDVITIFAGDIVLEAQKLLYHVLHVASRSSRRVFVQVHDPQGAPRVMREADRT